MVTTNHSWTQLCNIYLMKNVITKFEDISNYTTIHFKNWTIGKRVEFS